MDSDRRSTWCDRANRVSARRRTAAGLARGRLPSAGRTRRIGLAHPGGGAVLHPGSPAMRRSTRPPRGGWAMCLPGRRRAAGRCPGGDWPCAARRWMSQIKAHWRHTFRRLDAFLTDLRRDRRQSRWSWFRMAFKSTACSAKRCGGGPVWNGLSSIWCCGNVAWPTYAQQRQLPLVDLLPHLQAAPDPGLLAWGWGWNHRGRAVAGAAVCGWIRVVLHAGGRSQRRTTTTCAEPVGQAARDGAVFLSIARRCCAWR